MKPFPTWRYLLGMARYAPRLYLLHAVLWAVMDLLSELHQGGATICMVTHDSRFAGYADLTVHLFDGQIVAENSESEGETTPRVVGR